MRKHATFLVLLAFLMMILPMPALAAEPVKIVTVSVYPLAPNTAGQYTIGFYTSSTGALSGGSDDIIITFPEGTTLPSSIGSGKITVNGVSVSSSDLDIDENILSIELPNNVSVAAGGYVGIIIPESVGIKAPARAGSQYLKVGTSKDSPRDSNAFTLEGTRISDLTVAVTPGTIDKYAAYEINFKTSSKGALTGGEDYIYLEFIDKVGLPSSITGSYVTVNGKSLSSGDVEVNRNKNLITLRLPSNLNIAKSNKIEVKISVDARIRNPKESGDYELKVYTSKDAYYRADEYTVGITVSTPVVQVSPLSANTAAQYSIGFTTSDEGALYGGQDYIYLYFPEGTYLPGSINRSDITVNGYDASSVSVSWNELRIAIRVPSGLNIRSNSYVGVVVHSKAGVKNPSKSGEYRLLVSTTEDSSKVNSEEYKITGGTSSVGSDDMDITLVPRAVGEETEIRLIAESSSLGKLEEGDKLALDFPKGFTLPSSISVSRITVNGEQVKNCEINGRELKFALAKDIAEDDDVDILIAKSAGIKNPEEDGKYELELSGSTSSVSGTVTIGDAAITKPAVILTNNKAGTASQYFIALTAEEDYDWEKDDIISITFPEGTILPTSAAAERIIIASILADSVVISGNTISLYLNNDLVIEEDEQLVILIPEIVGIKNPTVNGDYTLTLKLPGEDALQSQAYRIQGGTAAPAPVSTSKKVVFRVGSTLYSDRGVLQTMEAAPTIINGRTMIPVRAVGNALGAQTSYDGTARTVNIKVGGKEILLIIDSTLAKVNNEWVSLDTAATITNGRTLIPVRFVSQHFGAVVEWDAATQEVIINK